MDGDGEQQGGVYVGQIGGKKRRVFCIGNGAEFWRNYRKGPVIEIQDGIGGVFDLWSRSSSRKFGKMEAKHPETLQAQSPPLNPSLEVIKDENEFVQRFQALYNSELFSDIVLRVGEHQFYAHKFLLITSSEVFEAMLNEERWREANQPEVTLTEDEDCIPVFGDFLKYIYCGTVCLTTSCVLPILLLADKYCIRKLCESCVNYMLQHIVESPDTNRTLSWYQYAKMTGCTHLQESCLKFILSNFHVVQNSPDWLDLSQMEIKEFLESSDIVVENEFQLWIELEKWFVHQENIGQLEEKLREILPLIRFSLLTPKQLLLVENSPLFKKYPQSFGDKIWQAYRRHSLLGEVADAPLLREEYRNYDHRDYGIACSLQLSNYVLKSKIDSKISEDNFKVPLHFAPGVATSDSKYVKFTVDFYPKGHFVPHMLYSNYLGRHNKNTTLIIKRITNNCPKMNVEVTFLIFGKKNKVRFAAHFLSKSYTFSKVSTKLEIVDVIPVDKLLEEKSAYLVNGNFEGQVFLKIQSLEEDDTVV